MALRPLEPESVHRGFRNSLKSLEMSYLQSFPRISCSPPFVRNRSILPVFDLGFSTTFWSISHAPATQNKTANLATSIRRPKIAGPARNASPSRNA